MKRKISFLLSLLIVVLFINLLISACTKQDMSIEQKEDEEIALDVGGKDNDVLERSENISNLIVNLYGIDNATSIIFNDTVAIGLEVAEGSKLDKDMKEMIIQAVLENDDTIKQVVVTDNKKIFNQIEDIVLSLINGKPYDRYVKEINKIIEKIKKE